MLIPAVVRVEEGGVPVSLSVVEGYVKYYFQWARIKAGESPGTRRRGAIPVVGTMRGKLRAASIQTPTNEPQEAAGCETGYSPAYRQENERAEPPVTAPRPPQEARIPVDTSQLWSRRKRHNEGLPPREGHPLAAAVSGGTHPSLQ